MEILRVFNNNVVLAAADDGREVILTGRGLGFQARPGQEVDATKVVRTFVPTDGRDPDHLAQLLAALLELRLGAALTNDEISYLALHVARVAADPA